MGSQPCTQGLGRRWFWPHTPASPLRPQGRKRWVPQMQNQDLGRPRPGGHRRLQEGPRGAPGKETTEAVRGVSEVRRPHEWGSPLGRGCRLVVESHVQPPPRAVGVARRASDWAGRDTLGRAGAAPRRTAAPWPWTVSRASPSQRPKEAALTGVSRASAWWESTDRPQGCEEGWRRARCPEHQGELGGPRRPGGSQSACSRGLPASHSGGTGGMPGSGVVASRCPRGPAL